MCVTDDSGKIVTILSQSAVSRWLEEEPVCECNDCIRVGWLYILGCLRVRIYDSATTLLFCPSCTPMRADKTILILSLSVRPFSLRRVLQCAMGRQLDI